ncbi:MAG: hypothetical protein CR968_04010 [Flavobacteriia bacterium]|nr:MAG: hypothetical protein CR968_04010 [Flavobacteriia bacterium]
MTKVVRPDKMPVFYLPLLFFVLSVCIGLLLRANNAYSWFDLAYNRLLQAHSHVTFLGWGFLATLVLIHKKKQVTFDSVFRVLWLLLNVAVTGMLVAFIYVGYKPPSIAFLVLFLLTSYIYLIKLYRKLGSHRSLSNKLIRWGIIYYFISSLAVWIIPVVLLKTGKDWLYYDLIYFYLHFLYNGYFVFVILGLILHQICKHNPEHSYLKKAFLWLNMAVVPAYFLSLYWHTTRSFVLYFGSISGTFQLIGLGFLLGGIYKTTSAKLSGVLRMILVIFSIKVVLQFLSAFPSLAEKVLTFKPYFVIGYIHWVGLGFISMSLLWLYGFKERLMKRLAFIFFISGFLLTELMLFYQGTAIMYGLSLIKPYNVYLFLGSVLIVIGVVLFLIQARQQR